MVTSDTACVRFSINDANVGGPSDVAAVSRINAGPIASSTNSVFSAFSKHRSSSYSPKGNHQLESRMREIRTSGSEGGAE